MRKIPYLIAAAAISGFALSATPGIASPLAGGLTGGNVTVPEASEGLIQKVHGYHCRKRYSHRRGWHRHRRACHYSYRYRPYRYGFGAPFVAFSFGFGPRHRHRHRHWRHWDWD
jgi:hypothetical protein